MIMCIRFPHIAAEGETISAEGMECHLGGKGLNQSVAIARAGSRVYQGGGRRQRRRPVF